MNNDDIETPYTNFYPKDVADAVKIGLNTESVEIDEKDNKNWILFRFKDPKDFIMYKRKNMFTFLNSLGNLSATYQFSPEYDESNKIIALEFYVKRTKLPKF